MLAMLHMLTLLPTLVASRTRVGARRMCSGPLARLGADRSGNIGMLFAFMIIPVVGIIGFSVDYGRALDSRTVLQSALDSAVLAAGREYQVSGNPASAESVAAVYFNNTLKGVAGVEIVENTANTENSTMRFTGRIKVRTAFARLLGFDEIAVSSTSESLLARGGIDNHLEISLMLDVTGSMCQPCSKLADLQDAAKDLINILVQDDQSEYTSRVALVPFSHAVNAGPYFEQVTGVPQSGGGYSYSSCVVERQGSNKFTDARPGSGVQTYLGIYDVERADANNVKPWTPCKPVTEMMPLTSDKEALNDAIDDFEASGFTAGQIGTGWAWYTLSPLWNEIWPAESQAAAYGDTETTKIAVLMTDGDYNTAYETGNGSSSAQAKQLCKGMRDEGITVYTVGFMVSKAAKKLLEECATSSSHFYNATDGEQLKIAFRSIAFKVSQIRLSK